MKEFCLLHSLLLLVISFEGLSFNESVENLGVAPKYQTVKENEDAIIDCFNFGKTYWRRKDGKPLPKQATQTGNRLYINNIKLTDSGYYMCFGEFDKYIGRAFISVVKKATAHIPRTEFTTTGLKEYYPATTDAPLQIPSFFTTHAVFSNPVTHYPCLYGLCNGTCCVGTGVESFFDCANGQKINKSLVCNQQNDCTDGSDEAKCSPWPPKITLLPETKVEVFCGDQDKSKAGVLVLECRSVGHPMPLIKWKKYEGHVPSKCVQTSRGGLGRLECPNFQESDQGAYSCVAENLLKSAESQPKSVAKCSNVINCKGFKVVNEHQIEHCLECFCSGKTSFCQGIKSKLAIHKFSIPKRETEVFANDNGEVVFVPTKYQPLPNPEIRESATEITYCSLSEDKLKEVSFLKSFGRNLIIPRFTGKRDFLPQAPDVIIQGSGLSLIYTFSRIFPTSGDSSGVSVRFWPGNWHHIDKKIASRLDLMKVLSNLDSLLLRCEYVRGNVLSFSEDTTVTLETSVISNFTDSASYVEKCNCPVGYDGLSCESCADGYAKKIQENDFVCEKIHVAPKTCKQGYVGADCTNCDEKNGYVKQGDKCVKFTCDPIGSTSPKPNLFGNCSCRVGVTGEFCERCQNDHFYLEKDKGCSKCWCSGVTDQCTSSKLFRTVISKIPHGGYNSSDGRNFWLLPSDFSGNRLTSYGGFLNYTMKYKPGIAKEKTYLTVEFLSLEDDTLVYTHSSIDKSLLTNEKSWSVPITEEKWKKPDKSSITRGEFLSVLSKIKAIYIESPYHLSSGFANLTLTRMTSATSYGDDDSEPALAVEQCNCPVGYSGLSCESCSEGYYKKRNGSITQCLKCNCSYCDPELGCPDCPGMTYRDNPEHEKMPVCKPCPCNNNALACSKDDYNQVICRCKPGFTGMHCEKIMPSPSDHDLTLRISPRRIRNKKVGSEVSFNCSYSSKESMSLSAQKTFTENHPNSVLSPIIDAENETVENDWIVKNFKISLEDGLKFVECFLHDAEGKLAGHIRTVVEDLITIVKPVKITKCHETVIKLKESESKELICEATGSPPPMITWYKSKMNEAVEKVDTVDGIHSIESATLEQNGTVYTCVAENSEGDKATCPVVLIVTRKCEIVTIEPPRVEEEEGRNVSISCKTSAKSNVTWSRLNRLLSSRSSIENDYLKIYNATVSDSGTYVCKALGQDNNTINSTVEVTIHEKRIPPSVEISDDDKILHVGDVFEVKCIGYGKPLPVIRWRKKNNPLDANVFVRGNFLTINKATVQNTGIYACEGSSVFGNATAYISIEVRRVTIPPTVVLSQDSVKAHPGEEVTLTCTVKGFPQPETNWLTPGFNGTQFIREQDSSESTDALKVLKETITFNVTQDMDGKKLICQAEGLNNNVAESTKITVLQPKIAINESVKFARLGSYFVLQCGSIHDNVSWDKIGGLLGDECKVLNRLTFESVQVQHNGTYICKTESNSKHIINLIVTGFVPKFSQDKSSYMVLPMHLKSPLGFRIEMSFNPVKEYGLLLHRENHLLDLYLKGGKVHLGAYTEEGDFFDIVMKEPLQLRKWYSLIVTISSQYIDITVYDQQMSIYGRRTESSESLKINIGSGKETFFVGGAKSSMNMRHPHKLFLTHFRSFDGCISRLTIDRHEFDLVKESSYSEKVHLCNKCLDEPNVCGARGKCLDAPTQYGFICVCNEESEKSKCRPGCTGKGCETQLDLCTLLLPCSDQLLHTCANKMYHLECNCAYGYSGVTCDRAVEYSFCANGDGYVRLPNLFKRHSIDEPETIKIKFQLNKLEGLLLWQGNKRNYLSISVEDGNVKYIYHNQKSELMLVSTDKLPLQTEVELSVKRMNNTAHMSVSHSTETDIYKNHTRFTTNRVFGDIYVGNAPESIDNNAGLDGCIYYISFGDDKIDLREKQLERINVFLPASPPSDSEEYDSDESNTID